MAPGPEQRRDTVAVPRQALQFVLSLAAILVAGVSAVLWSVVADSIDHSARLKNLEGFGPGTGERWTKADAVRENGRQDREIERLRDWIEKHRAKVE